MNCKCLAGLTFLACMIFSTESSDAWAYGRRGAGTSPSPSSDPTPTPQTRTPGPGPLGIPTFSQSTPSGSDQRSQKFNRDYLPIIRNIAQSSLGEGRQLAGYQTMPVDTTRLILRKKTADPIRIYFITETTGATNSLGFSYTLAGSSTLGKPYYAFPYCLYDYLSEGDYVDIDYGGNGWQLDLFMVANGQAAWTWWSNKSRNSDGLQHLVSFPIPNSPYLMIGFDDAPGGGDRDFNDLVIVVDLGVENMDGVTGSVTLPN